MLFFYCSVSSSPWAHQSSNFSHGIFIVSSNSPSNSLSIRRQFSRQNAQTRRWPPDLCRFHLHHHHGFVISNTNLFGRVFFPQLKHWIKSKNLSGGGLFTPGSAMIHAVMPPCRRGPASNAPLRATSESSLNCIYSFILLSLSISSAWRWSDWAFGSYPFVFVFCREVYGVSIVGPFPVAVTNLLDLTRLYVSGVFTHD